ncbi:MAG: hypothetical protein ACI8T1_005388, partial [Verrucomicrobiales bacterium]
MTKDRIDQTSKNRRVNKVPHEAGSLRHGPRCVAEQRSKSSLETPASRPTYVGGSSDPFSFPGENEINLDPFFLKLNAHDFEQAEAFLNENSAKMPSNLKSNLMATLVARRSEKEALNSVPCHSRPCERGISEALKAVDLVPRETMTLLRFSSREKNE